LFRSYSYIKHTLVDQSAPLQWLRLRKQAVVTAETGSVEYVFDSPHTDFLNTRVYKHIGVL